MDDAEARPGGRGLEPIEPQAIRSQAGSFRGLGWARYVSLHLNGATAVHLIDLTPAEAAARLARLLEEGSGATGLVAVAFMNMRNYVAARRAAVTAFPDMDQVYPDGVGLQIGRHLLGLPRFSRVSGTDTVPLLLAQLRPGTRLGGCDAAAGFFYLAPTGDVYPCLTLPRVIGNIRSTPFDALWGSDEARRIRDEASRCRKCWMMCTARTELKRHPVAIAWWVGREQARSLFDAGTSRARRAGAGENASV